MDAAKKAPVKKVTAKKAPAKKVAAKKAAPKTAAKKAPAFSLKASAEKAVNIYLGVIGNGYDRVQTNLESARKENVKRMTTLEKRGAKLRKEMNKNITKIETPELDNVMKDVKSQINKLQDQIEDAVETAKEKLTPAKKAA
jgi:hypothetical protein